LAGQIGQTILELRRNLFENRSKITYSKTQKRVIVRRMRKRVSKNTELCRAIINL
jgi:hypothetical protein